MKKIYSSKQLEKIDLGKITRKIPINKSSLKSILKLKINIETLNLNLELELQNALLTSYTVAIISSAIGIILPHIVKPQDLKQCKYQISPVYNNTDTINLYLNSTINIKIVNIIILAYNLLKNKKQAPIKPTKYTPYLQTRYT